MAGILGKSSIHPSVFLYLIIHFRLPGGAGVYTSTSHMFVLIQRKSDRLVLLRKFTENSNYKVSVYQERLLHCTTKEALK